LRSVVGDRDGTNHTSVNEANCPMARNNKLSVILAPRQIAEISRKGKKTVVQFGEGSTCRCSAALER
jgi:hypothetical protein